MCWGACVGGGPKSLLFIEVFFEAAVLVSVCQEHGKWRLGKRRKVERRKDARRVGWMPEGVVHAGVLLGCVLGCVRGVPVGGPCVGRTLL
ncbi:MULTISPECIES: hypothetical protein [unclassified Bartonella]|uniref:hypothetical protein n=1 Tax=unclassified Bartonella TaxID=2645622 RepID=UPI0035D0414F